MQYELSTGISIRFGYVRCSVHWVLTVLQRPGFEVEEDQHVRHGLIIQEKYHM